MHQNAEATKARLRKSSNRPTGASRKPFADENAASIADTQPRIRAGNESSFAPFGTKRYMARRLNIITERFCSPAIAQFTLSQYVSEKKRRLIGRNSSNC